MGFFFLPLIHNNSEKTKRKQRGDIETTIETTIETILIWQNNRTITAR